MPFLPPLRVLLIEPHTALRGNLTKTLQQHGATVLAAAAVSIDKVVQGTYHDSDFGAGELLGAGALSLLHSGAVVDAVIMPPEVLVDTQSSDAVMALGVLRAQRGLRHTAALLHTGTTSHQHYRGTVHDWQRLGLGAVLRGARTLGDAGVTMVLEALRLPSLRATADSAAANNRLSFWRAPAKISDAS